MGKRRERPEPTEKREAGERRRDNLIQVGVDPDTWKEFEDWRVERELSPSEAARRLIRDGLDDRDDTTDPSKSFVLLLFGAFGAFAILTGEPKDWVYPATALLLLAGAYLRVINR